MEVMKNMVSSQHARMMRRIAAVQQKREESDRDNSAVLEETKVYIGLNDSETKEQKLETDRYISILKKICQAYDVPFSFNVVEGGYMHDNGEYTEEKSIVLTFIDVKQETVDEVAKEACVLFHQESVLITVDQIHARSIRESL